MRHRKVPFSEIEEIIRKCDFCHIGMIDQQGLPYVLPFNFGYDEGILYFHSAPEGKKIQILRNNPNLCVEFSTDCQLAFQNEETACSYSMKYRSVLAFGKAEFIEEDALKITALNIIMKNYSPHEFKYSPPSIRNVSCWKMKVDLFEGRAFGY